ncbi:sulfate ABC transporter permease subunit CysT [Alcaligenes aquatilis]|jgi:sulfate transport system permease protein|uniref:Sulfate transport system permease protein CysT n=1 Tax=Alcaligenes faecalis TaxID=511 RepID=A0AB33CWT1_ALCFA|nr:MULTISPECIES: sulfate ABC transporter permease subunit CysT [Alcaligenes]ASR91055.1 sulfate ABC transporter permease subunit CysT [Alcaligenes faecalis]MCC9164705.1 sulfate ABC transporter permease subunit CysT [Alcaligenes sp. MMA]MCH4225327.1 sulfate ABC transporter permease subunit CysT [Alcaligenes faecalis]HBQ90217.1 sulfate ABC transporter permease subunit CysT [Alcaligenes faecalis]
MSRTFVGGAQDSGAKTALKPLFFLRRPVMPGFGLSFGFSVLYLSIIVLLPLSALFMYVSDMSLADYWRAVTDKRVVSSYQVTISAALYSTLTASVVGFIIAWIITRFEFPGRRLIDALVDLPFALPTSVAGLTLATLFVPGGWFGQFLPEGWKIAYQYPGIVLAMTFTSLPFVVRIVQPVIEELGAEYEEVAHTLGASGWQTFSKVVFPPLIPALVTGASQAFIRSLGEFGAVIMIAGNIPYKTEVSSLMIFVRLQEFNYPAAAAIASVILIASLLLLFTLQLVQNRLLGWQRRAS